LEFYSYKSLPSLKIRIVARRRFCYNGAKMKLRAAVSLACLLAALPLRPAGRPLTIAATIFPAADIARRVAGAGVRVILVLPPGASPHTFELTPGKVRELQPARLIFKIGGVDDWIDGVAESLPRARIVPLHAGIARIAVDGHEHGDGHHHEDGLDPHYWLSAANGAAMAATIAAELAKADPQGAAEYRANGRAAAAELMALHDELRRTLEAATGRSMIVFHDGWRYFAAAYGLQIGSVFQASPGREPSPRDLQALYRAARRIGARVLFSEPQLPASSVEPVLRDLGLRLVVLDPIGGAAGGDSYAGLLRRNARAVAAALAR
jgi:ABC-type Zn uptake system ZnuABC Zn-binding protein ZnuA